jgi:hypothetical protein
MATIETLGVHPIQLPHAFGQIGLGGLDHQMIMVAHLSPGMTNPMVNDQKVNDCSISVVHSVLAAHSF